MPPGNDPRSASIALAIGLCLISLFLGLRQWYERKAREPDLSEADRRHFWRQDTRRNLGVAVLFGIAILVVVGTNMWPMAQGGANVLFVQIWVAVLVLVVVLLTLALADWSATRAYARRHRREILREAREAIRREARQAYLAQLPEERRGTARPRGSLTDCSDVWM